MLMLVRRHDIVILCYIDRFLLGQLRGNFSSMALSRMVELTIETNALTGTCFSENLTDVDPTCCLAAAVIGVLVLYAAFPVS